MGKDLSDEWRDEIAGRAKLDARALSNAGQSLALAREAWLNAFDKAAEDLTRQAAMNTLLKIDGPLYGGENG